MGNLSKPEVGRLLAMFPSTVIENGLNQSGNKLGAWGLRRKPRRHGSLDLQCPQKDNSGDFEPCNLCQSDGD